MTQEVEVMGKMNAITGNHKNGEMNQKFNSFHAERMIKKKHTESKRKSFPLI